MLANRESPSPTSHQNNGEANGRSGTQTPKNESVRIRYKTRTKEPTYPSRILARQRDEIKKRALLQGKDFREILARAIDDGLQKDHVGAAQMNLAREIEAAMGAEYARDLNLAMATIRKNFARDRGLLTDDGIPI